MEESYYASKLRDIQYKLITAQRSYLSMLTQCKSAGRDENGVFTLVFKRVRDTELIVKPYGISVVGKDAPVIRTESLKDLYDTCKALNELQAQYDKEPFRTPPLKTYDNID